jgi:hypothetical protein
MFKFITYNESTFDNEYNFNRFGGNAPDRWQFHKISPGVGRFQNAWGALPNSGFDRADW